MRLAGVISYAQANVFLLDYIPVYNQRFAVQPRNLIDSHEPLLPENNLEAILSKQSPRKLSKDLQLQYQKVIYQIITDRPAYPLRGRTVTVCESELGKIRILLNGAPLDFKTFYNQPKQAVVVTSKDINHRRTKPAPNHPWRNYGLHLNSQPVQSQNRTF